MRTAAGPVSIRSGRRYSDGQDIFVTRFACRPRASLGGLTRRFVLGLAGAVDGADADFLLRRARPLGQDSVPRRLATCLQRIPREERPVPARSARHGYLQALKVPLALVFIAATAMMTYYWVYVQRQADYFTNRNFRKLAMMSDQLEAEFGSVAACASLTPDPGVSAQPRSRSGNTLKEDLDISADRRRLLSVSRTCRCCTATPRWCPPCATRPGFGGCRPPLRPARTTSGRDPARRGVRAAAGSLRQEGSLRQRAAGGCEWTRAAPERRPHAPAHQPGQPPAKPRQRFRQDPGGASPGRSGHALGQCLRCRHRQQGLHNLPRALLCCDRQRQVRAGLARRGAGSKSSLRTASLSVSFSMMALLTGLLLLAAFSWPFVKLTLIGRLQRVPFHDVVLMGFCTILAARCHDCRARCLRIREAEGRPGWPARSLCQIDRRQRRDRAERRLGTTGSAGQGRPRLERIGAEIPNLAGGRTWWTSPDIRCSRPSH